jgi:hypothetical protein
MIVNALILRAPDAHSGDPPRLNRLLNPLATPTAPTICPRKNNRWRPKAEASNLKAESKWLRAEI